MKKVLIVDDDAHERTVLTDILGAEGFSTVAASDGREALKVLEREAIGLIITDRSMPHMDGFELLKTLHQKKSTIPAIMISAYGEEKLWGEALGWGAKEYLLKPFNPDEVVALIRKYLKEKKT